MSFINQPSLDLIARFFLTFSDWTIIIPVVLVGLFINNKLFYNLICLILFSILVNVALKVSFHVPLNPSLGKFGFAFPSGHMQLSTVLYGWVFWHISNKYLRLSCVLILVGIGLSLIHFSYHDLFDVIGGVVFAALLISIYSHFLQGRPVLVFVLATGITAYNYLCYQLMPSYAANAYYLLTLIIFLELVWRYFSRQGSVNRCD